MNIGKFIVIDGTDGSGKATQTKLLVERLAREGHPVRSISFPRYGQKSAGPVEEYLSGTYGTAEAVGAYRASVLYAVDRFAASGELRGWLDAGNIVVADRYVAANMGHQGGKIADPEERRRFLEWNDGLEYGLFGIPRPDLNLILHVPPEVSVRLMADRSKLDIHEQNLAHLKDAEACYLDIARSSAEFQLIECAPCGEILTREQIHGLIWEAVAPLLG